MLTDTTYHLDLPTLLQFLRDQSAQLSTMVEVPSSRGLCYGYLLLKNRTIIGCQIQSQDGRVLYKGQEAYQLLTAKTQWQVRVDSARVASTRVASTRDDSTRVASTRVASTRGDGTKAQGRPRRIANAIPSLPDIYVPRIIKPLEPSLLNGYTMRQRVILRTVFAMINGQRAVSQMKGQLHLSSEAVDEALIALKSIRVID
jgi:hypothetical protein